MNRKPGRNTIVVSLILLGLLLAGMALILSRGEAEAESSDAAIKTHVAEQGTVSRTIESPAISEPHIVRTFRSPFGGELKYIAAVGQEVAEGETLVQLDDQDAARQVLLAEISLQESQLNLEQARMQLAQAERVFRDRQALYDSGSVSLEQVQNAREQKESANFRLRSAELLLRKDQADLDAARIALAAAAIRAPFSGIVLSTEFSEGDWVGQNNALLRIGDVSSLRFTAEVDEFDVGRLAVGQQVQIRSDVPDSPVLRARLETISPQAEIMNNIAVFRISAVADNSQAAMRPGMTVDMVVVLERDTGIVVPVATIETVRTRSYVDVYLDGEIETRRVEIGGSDGRNTVISEGLEEGELVVLPDAPADVSEMLFAPPPAAPSTNSIVPMPSGAGGGRAGGGSQ